MQVGTNERSTNKGKHKQEEAQMRVSKHAGGYEKATAGTHEQKRVLHEQGPVLQGRCLQTRAGAAQTRKGHPHSSSSSPSDTLKNVLPHQLTCAGCFHEVAMRLEEDKPMGIERTVQHRGQTGTGIAGTGVGTEFPTCRLPVINPTYIGCNRCCLQ